MLPEKNAALVVLVNHGSHPLPNAVTPDLLDRLLGLTPGDNSAKAVARRNAAEAAPARPDVVAPAALAGTQPSRALAAYAGAYRHRGYGEMAVTVTAGSLAVRYNDMQAALQHWHYDVFAARTERPEHGEFNGLKLSFQGDETGRIAACVAQMQDGVQPIWFARVV